MIILILLNDYFTLNCLLGCINFLQGRNQKTSCLASTVLRTSQNIAVSERNGNSFFLNRRRTFKAHLVNSHQELFL